MDIVDVRTSETIENFYKDLSQTEDTPGLRSQYTKMLSRKIHFAASVMRLELRRKIRKIK